MLVLFLDDSVRRAKAAAEQFAGDTFCLAGTADTAIEYLRLAEEPWDLVMLDHDLGGKVFQDSLETNTGMEVVRYIERTQPEIKRIVVHSWNSPAAREMVSRLEQAGYEASYQPFEA
jgi:DNA-binding NarL/FixJ family response regulator